MRLTIAAAAALVALATWSGVPGPVAAGGLTNPDGYGLYSPAPRRKHRPRVYRYDPYSWYHQPRGYYPYYASNYWVPRKNMRYRWRYMYYGPKYRYYPAWGYPLNY
jgi:hypothetical protein